MLQPVYTKQSLQIGVLMDAKNIFLGMVLLITMPSLLVGMQEAVDSPRIEQIERVLHEYNPRARPVRGILKNRSEVPVEQPALSAAAATMSCRRVGISPRAGVTSSNYVWCMHMPRGKNSFVWFGNEHLWQQMPQTAFRFLTKQNPDYAQDERVGLVPVAVSMEKQKVSSDDERQRICLAGPQNSGDGRTPAYIVARSWETTRASQLAWWYVHKYRVMVLDTMLPCPFNKVLGMARVAYKVVE